MNPTVDGDRDAKTLRRLVSDLQRYSGWLARNPASVAVQADIQALNTAMNTGHEMSGLALTLDEDLRRLPSGSVRKILRKLLGEVRAALEPIR